jgi:hypothetical protein
VSGEYDHLPEAAFYMVGNMDEAIERSSAPGAGSGFGYEPDEGDSRSWLLQADYCSPAA